MVMGSLSAPHFSKDDGATVYGLKSDERATLVRVIMYTVVFIFCDVLQQYLKYVAVTLQFKFQDV